MKFPFYRQLYQMDCGPACLKMIAKYHGKILSIEQLRELVSSNREGVSLNEISEAAERIGMRTLGVKIGLKQLNDDAQLPCVLHWNEKHFVVLYKIRRGKYYVADPSIGLLKHDMSAVEQYWLNKANKGIALFLSPGPAFDNQENSSKTETFNSPHFIWTYLSPFKSYLVQLGLGLICASMIQLAFPFITQSVVDIGINSSDLSFIQLLLLAQIFLFLGRISVEAIRSWILLHLSSRINISMLSDYLIKLMKLPIAYFDLKMTGDILQRINDHKRVESLMTNGSLSVCFSAFNLLIFGGILLLYDWRIFLIFFIGSSSYVIWVLLFMRWRKELDYQRFGKMGEEQSKVIEMIHGMQEIKLNNAERKKRWAWESDQADLYKISLKSLKLEQFQSVGGNFINEIKNILITFISAYLVIKEQISLGMMLAISYILGQLNAPLSQLISFSYSLQDAKIALERLGEVHSMKEEHFQGNQKLNENDQLQIEVKQLSFKYPGASKACLSKLNFKIPYKKTTALVGMSGSGKSTLLKILLQFYKTQKGGIWVNRVPLDQIDRKSWRDKCGAVLQDGHIFNDSIEQNICLGRNSIDSSELQKALKVARLDKFIRDLPLGIKTEIGQEGVGLSGGQKQRILIARAVYKNPELILFDEATSSLDAVNERAIIENLSLFLKDKTAVVIAHRLSTIKDADQIVMMKNGRAVEIGSHHELLEKKGFYFKMINQQLSTSSTLANGTNILKDGATAA